jgi:hypothetical protein
MQKFAQQQSVLFSKLHLDGQNPRHEPTAEEPSIIAYLIRNEQVLPLAQDICNRGLSPLERLAAIPHPTLDGHFVMVEGNRRLCAIKLLRDPAKAPAADRKAFKRLSDLKPTLPRKLDVAVFESRELANDWIALKHGGLQGGIGTRNWNASQSSRFLESLTGGKRPNSLALAVLDYAQDHNILSQPQRASIALTTVTRYLTNPVVRSALGICSASEFLVDVPLDEFNAVLAQFLSDLQDGTEVNSRSKSADRASYGRKLLASGLSPSTRLAIPISPVAPDEQAASSQARSKEQQGSSNSKTTRNNRNPDLGTKVVRTGYAVHISDPTTKRVFDELRDLDGSRFPFAAACLLRLFMERTCRAYAKKMGLGDTGELAPVIGRCAEHMERKAGATKDVFQVWRTLASNPSHYLSPGHLSSYVHGGSTPVLTELRRGWTDLEKGLDLMLTALR